ncbi:Hypp2520 [Branchiostoma lanceolatum]|uniref:Hypp2520 protein n=1 Tax=Branchiostoma lanceolatum TaxID=7740 RepID=A0A8K0ETG9_BRALA|nr:Hypp2520 [Branchiostoma lanceolatum]
MDGRERTSPGELSVRSWPMSAPRRVKSRGSQSDIGPRPQGPIYRRNRTAITYDVYKGRCSGTHVLEQTDPVDAGKNTTRSQETPESRFVMADEDCLCGKVFHMSDAIAVVPPGSTPRTKATARWFTPTSVKSAGTDCRHPGRLTTSRATMCRGDKHIMGRLWELNSYLDNGDIHRPFSGPPAHPWFKTRLCAVHDLRPPTPTTPQLPALPNRTDRFEQVVRREARANARRQLPGLRTVTLVWRNMRGREAYSQQELHHFVSMIGPVDAIMLLGPTSARVVFKDTDAACRAVNATGKFGRPDNRLYCNWLHRGMDNKKFRLKGRQLVVQYDPILYS